MKNIKEILTKTYENDYLRRNIVPLFIGNPGLGKTVFIEQFAKEKGVQLVEMITSQMSPFEVSGICIPDKDTKQMMYYNLDRLENLKDGDILFFDELLNGNPVVLNACLTILEQRRFISGKPLPNVMIVAAANPQGMTPLTPQIKERFVWYQVNFDRDLWEDYMAKKYFMPKKISRPLSKLIMEEKFTSQNFHTPRSIEKALNMLIHNVPTPYEVSISWILNQSVKNSLDQKVKLDNTKTLEKNEQILWLELIKIKHGVINK